MLVKSDATIHADVAVVGAGVAGSALAAALAGAGLGVVIVEREPRFRDRVRGEGIHPWGVREAEKLGLRPVLEAAGALELMTWQVYGGRQPVFDFRWDDFAPNWPGEWAIYHPILQQELLDHAQVCGATVVRPAKVTGFRRAARSELTISSDSGDTAIDARLVVAADGRQSAGRAWVDASTVHDPVHHQIGGCLLADVTVPADRSHMAFMPGMYSIIFPQRGGRARVYLICFAEVANRFRGHGHEEEFIRQLAANMPAGMLGEPTVAGPLAFFPGADIWADRLAGDGIALIGDAAGANDPSMGNGLSIAFRDARELRDWLLGEPDWDAALAGYAAARSTYYAVLRAHTQWQTHLWLDVGPEADARRARAEQAAQLDAVRMGFGTLTAFGPDGVVLSDAARRHYFGEDLPDA